MLLLLLQDLGGSGGFFLHINILFSFYLFFLFFCTLNAMSAFQTSYKGGSV